MIVIIVIIINNKLRRLNDSPQVHPVDMLHSTQYCPSYDQQ